MFLGSCERGHSYQGSSVGSLVYEGFGFPGPMCFQSKGCGFLISKWNVTRYLTSGNHGSILKPNLLTLLLKLRRASCSVPSSLHRLVEWKNTKISQGKTKVLPDDVP